MLRRQVIVREVPEADGTAALRVTLVVPADVLAQSVPAIEREVEGMCEEALAKVFAVLTGASPAVAA